MKKNKKKTTIKRRVLSAVAVAGLVLTLISVWILSDSMNYVETDLMQARLEMELDFVQDELLSMGKQLNWSLRDGALYFGQTLMGDGSTSNANNEIFRRASSKTGSFYYLFLRTFNDEELGWVEKGGYRQGHYMRVAGTTTGPNGERLEGTYIDKKIADALENSASGIYAAEANVYGRRMFCCYRIITDANGEVVGILSNGRSSEEMSSLISKMRMRGFILVALVMTLMSLALGSIVTEMLGSIRSIRDRLAVIGTGEFPERPLTVDSNDELADVADSVNRMVESLKENQRIGAELSLAADIQKSMLPTVFPPFPESSEFDLYATMDPAKEVGGDFYDFFLLDEEHVAFLVADVSGKGIPASLFMVIAKTLIQDQTKSGLTPASAFSKVNHMLAENNNSGMFVTAWMGVLDLTSGKLTYVNAGHNPPLLTGEDGDFAFMKCKPGFVLAGIDGVRYTQSTVQLRPGDRLFLYTDGVNESTDGQKQQYGNDRLIRYLNGHRNDRNRELLSGLRADIDCFVADAEQFDDITMLVMDFNRMKEDDGMVEREFMASDDKLQDVIGFTEEQLEAAGASMKETMQITVAVEEVFVNIAHYAYGGNSGRMHLSIGMQDGMMVLRFCDWGLPFDPLAKKDPDITLGAEERQIGGLGIYMVKKAMDDVQYRYENGRNILTLTKKIG